MSEHYTRNTQEVTHWCNLCQRFTQHKVDHGRMAGCLEHQVQEFTKAQLKKKEQAEREAENPNLFGGER